MFDAGAIMARLDIDTSGASRNLDEIEKRVEKFERGPHKVRLAVVFDQSDMARARKAFADLDKQISRDAAQRLQSGGSGSILGALNALFGGGSASTRGATPSGGGVAKIAGGGGGGGNFLGNLLGGLLGGRTGGGAAGKEIAKEEAKADAAVRSSLLRQIALGGIGQFGKVGGIGGVDSGLLGGIGPGILGLSTRSAGILGLGGSLLGALPALLGPLAALGVGGAGIGVLSLGAKQLIGTKKQPGQLYQPAQAVSASLKSAFSSGAQELAGPLKEAFGQIPKIMRSLGPDIKGAFAGAATLISPLLHGLTDIARDVLPGLGSAFRAVAPLMKPLLDGFGGLVKGLFPGLVKLLQSSLPAVKTFASILDMLGANLGKMLGLMAPVIRSSDVIFKSLASVISAVFPIVGHLVALFATALAPAFRAFAETIKAVLPVVNIIGKVITELAGAVLGDLASAFGAVASLLKGISPALQLLAKGLGQVFNLLENSGVFAVLGNALEAATKPLAALINAIVRGLVPFLPVVTRLISSLATDAVNILVEAIKVLVPIAIQLVNDALKPLLPVVKALEPIIATVAKALGQGLGAVLKVIAPILAKLAPYILAVAAAMKVFAIAMGIVDVVTEANPIGLIAIAVAGLIVGITLLVTHWKQVWTDIKHWAEDAWNFIYNGWGKYLLVFLGPVGLLALGAIELAKHWKQIWGDIKNWAMDAWNFLTHGWGQYLLPGFTLIRLGVEFLAHHWSHIWAVIRLAAEDFWRFFWTDFGAKILNFLTHTIPSWLDQAVNFFDNRFVQPLQQALSDLWQWLWTDFGAKIFGFFTKQIPNAVAKGVSILSSAWDDVKAAVRIPVDWVITNVINDGLIAAFDWISSKVGGPHIDPIKTFALGGLITQGTHGTADDVLARVSKGETVVPAGMSRMLAPLFGMLGIPGYAKGGVIGGMGKQRATDKMGSDSIGSKFGDIGKIILAIFTGNGTALTNAILDLFGISSGGAIADLAQLLTDIPKTLVSDVAHFFLSSASHIPNGNAIIQYAESFIGKVPYKWGGITPRGWDCSGFVDWVYEHFGINPPRTSEQMWQWVKRTTSPVAGGLVFMAGADGTVANPGHVGITISPSQMVNAFGTGFGTIISPIAGSGGGITGYGVPPFAGSGGTVTRFDRGGWLTGLGINTSGRPEAVLTHPQSNALVQLAQAAEAYSKMGGGRALMRDVHLMLPEGSTVADAMRELEFELRIAEQRGYAGVTP